MCARAQMNEIPVLSHYEPLPEGPLRYTNEYGMEKIMFRVTVSARAPRLERVRDHRSDRVCVARAHR